MLYAKSYLQGATELDGNIEIYFVLSTLVPFLNDSLKDSEHNITGIKNKFPIFIDSIRAIFAKGFINNHIFR